MAKGLDPNEGKNTKVTLELLQKLHYKDINQSQPDDFSPDRFVTDPEDTGDDDSVFDYFFPGSKKKKPKAAKKGENYSERIMNIKKTTGLNRAGPIRASHEVAFEEQNSTYKSDRDSNKNPKSHRSIQPSNPNQSKKSMRGTQSQANLNSRADVSKDSKHNRSSSKHLNSAKLGALAPSSVKKYAGAQTARDNNASAKKSAAGRSKSKEKSPKLRKSNQKSEILSKIAKIESLQKKNEKNSINRALKTHNNQLKKSQKFLK